MQETIAVKPRLRGVLHQWAFFVSIVAGSALVLVAPAGRATLATAILIVVWAAALGGIVLKLAWIDAPKWLVALIYVAIGWVALAAFPQLLDKLGVTATAMVAAGGLLYTFGALVYARKRPDPAPTVFGYHEIFHALVIAAAAVQYCVIAFFVV